MGGQNDWKNGSKVIFLAFSAIKNITINMHIRILNVINVFDVPTCPADSPVVGHSNTVGPLQLGEIVESKSQLYMYLKI